MREQILQLPYYRWLVFTVTSFGAFTSTLTSTIVNVALPPITVAFKTDMPTVQWIVTAYLLLITGLLPIAGRLGDLWGRRTVFSLGFFGFSVGCILCSLSPSIEILIAARLVQALGASCLMANSLAIITAIFPTQERGKVLGMVAMAVALGQISGPSIGGFLIAGFNWQSIFYISIVLGIAGFITAWLVLPDDKKMADVSIDYLGAFLFFAGMVSFLLAVNNGFSWGYKRTLVLVFLAAIVFLFFVRQEKRVAFPVLDLSIFKIRPFFNGNALGLIQYMAISANTILLPFFLHDIRVMPMTEIGLLMLVFPLLSAIITPFSGVLADRTSYGLLVALGLGFTTAGLYFTANMTLASSVWQIVAGQAVLGLGNALFQPANNSIVMGAAPADKLGIASGINALGRNMGMVIGTAVTVAVFDYKQLHHVQNALSQAVSSPETAAFINAYHDSMEIAALTAAAGFFLSLKRSNYIN